ncbi:MAG: 50S ribosomal protein L23 [candidate division FCPU426 bacterium]
MNPYTIIRRPLLTEKTNRAKEAINAYAFEVDARANKLQIKEAIETIFKVTVLRVNTTTVPGKSRRFGAHVTPKRNWRKAIATLKAGDRIEVYEGV